MSGDEPMGRFAVPSELLRLAGDDPDVAAPPPSAAPPPPVPRPNAPSLGEAVREHGWVALALSTAGASVTVAGLAAERAAAARVERTVHAGPAGIGGVLVAAVGLGLAAAPVGGWLADRLGRGRAAGVGVAVAGLAGLAAGWASSLSVLAVAMAAMGVAAGVQAVAAIGEVADRYPEGSRGRALAFTALALPAGALGAAGIAALASGTGSWRWAMLVSAAGLPIGVVMFRRASDRVNREVGLGATAQRLRRLRGLVGLVAATSALALVAIGAPIVASSELQHHWHQAIGRRGVNLLIAALGAVVGALLAGGLGDRAATGGVPRVATLTGGALVLAGAALAGAAYLPAAGVVEAALVVAVAASTAAAIGTVQWIVAVVPAGERSTAAGVFAAYGVVGGGLVATVVLTALAHADGARLALALGGVVVAAAGGVAWAVREEAGSDATASAQRQDVGLGQASPPALDVGGIDFSYGARQVLFGVGLAIEEGEAAALLGTNGAGKSTLLRLVAGLDHPARGSIRLFGRDTTFLEAEQVVTLGAALLPGGRMSFPGLTVIENLRVGGHTLRRQGARLDAAIEEVMALFPVLADRREQRVGTLSGGEQQMLALGRVLLTRPRLLLIDELSLGLAPKAVESLLVIVRRLNREGTTVLLVEQSVNLALSLCEHALFLERGEVRFDGRTADLLERNDLLRPIFLGAR